MALHTPNYGRALAVRTEVGMDLNDAAVTRLVDAAFEFTGPAPLTFNEWRTIYYYLNRARLDTQQKLARNETNVADLREAERIEARAQEHMNALRPGERWSSVDHTPEGEGRV